MSIPNIVLQPALDEVQGAVTKAANSIVNVASGVSQWNKDRVKSNTNTKKAENSSNGTLDLSSRLVHRSYNKLPIFHSDLRDIKPF